MIKQGVIIGLFLAIFFSTANVDEVEGRESFQSEELSKEQPTTRPPLMISVEDFALAIQMEFPHLSTKRAQLHAEAALTVSTKTAIDPFLLVGLVSVESNFNANTISRMQDFDGAWRRKSDASLPFKKPQNIRGPYFCGVTQVGGHISWKFCKRIVANIAGAYGISASHIKEWQNAKICRRAKDRLACALLGYGGGYKLIRNLRAKRARTYPSRVRAAAKRIRDTWLIKFSPLSPETNDVEHCGVDQKDEAF